MSAAAVVPVPVVQKKEEEAAAEDFRAVFIDLADTVEVDLGPADGDVVIDVCNTVTVTKLVAPDGGFGWAVAMASFVITFYLTGLSRSAVKFTPMMAAEWPGTTRDASGWVFGLIGSLSLLVSPASAMLVAQFGYRAVVICGGSLCSFGLFLSHFATSAGFLVGSLGVPMGIGSSLLITSVVGCTGKYFTDRRPAAVTLALTGGCVGAAAVPPVVGALLSAAGLRWTLIVLAGLFLLVPALGWLYGRPEDHFLSVTEEVEEDGAAPQVIEKPVVDSRNALRRFLSAASEKLGFPFLGDPAFVLLCGSLFAVQLGSPGFRGLLSGQAVSFGAAPEDAARLATSAAVGDLLARAVYGFLSSRSPFVRGSEFWVAAMVAGSAVTLMPFCSAFWLMSVLTVIAACASSVVTICTPLLLSANHGAADLTRTFGLARMFQGIAGLLIRPVSGLLRADQGSAIALVVSGTFLNTAAALALALWLIRGRL